MDLFCHGKIKDDGLFMSIIVLFNTAYGADV